MDANSVSEKTDSPFPEIRNTFKKSLFMIKTVLKSCAVLLLPIGLLAACKDKPSTATPEQAESVSARQCPVVFSADSAMAYVEAQCAFGPRVPNSEAHRLCGDYLVNEFRRRGLTVVEQKADLTAWDGNVLHSRNIIASYKPELSDRVIVCAHWDCRPWADADKDERRHREPVMGANDGASGVAVLLELARQLSQIAPKVGVDLICFDSEDYGRPYWAEGGDGSSDWCLGSQHWAQQPHVEGYAARYGILLDMVGGEGARFHYEGYSLQYAQPVVGKVWNAAHTAGFGEYFPMRDGGYVTDDHVPLNEVAQIPCIDIIPFNATPGQSFSPHWHTVNDTPENISPATLRAVGQTVVQVLWEEQ